MIKMADSTLNLEDADIDTIEPEVQEMIDTLRSESGKIDRAQELLKSEYEDLKKLYGDHVPDLDELNYNEAIVNAIRGGASIREAWEHNNAGGKKVQLTGPEYAEYQRIVGEETQKEFIKINPNASDKAKLDKMGDALTKAGQKGRQAILQGRGIRSTITSQGLNVNQWDLKLLP
jgi:hypothetical protein